MGRLHLEYIDDGNQNLLVCKVCETHIGVADNTKSDNLMKKSISSDSLQVLRTQWYRINVVAVKDQRIEKYSGFSPNHYEQLHCKKCFSEIGKLLTFLEAIPIYGEDGFNANGGNFTKRHIVLLNYSSIKPKYKSCKVQLVPYNDFVHLPNWSAMDDFEELEPSI